mmetsp:Transcript_19125/g.30703  ORF Transcript_19125/g.30703 Transcript_19125/m.30703 type:complete len:419 (-) Transcript_19125:84-1340(-)
MRSTTGTREARTVKFTPQVQTEVDPELWGVGSSASRGCGTYALLSVQISALVVLWWSAAIFVTMVIKITVGDKGKEQDAVFPYPFALTGMSNACTGLLAFSCSQLEKCSTPPVPKMTRAEWLKILVIGVIQGIEIGLVNKSLAFLTLSQRTMLNSLSVLFMMVTALCWRLEGLGILRVVAVLCLTFGGACQGFDDSGNGGYSESTHLIGVIVILSAMVIGTQRWALMQFVMQYSAPDSALGQISKFGFMSMIMPITGIVCTVLAALSEGDAYRLKYLRPDVAMYVVGIAAGVMALSFAELRIVHLTSAVAVQVLSTVHQIPIVLSGVIFFHDHVNIWGMIGFGLCMVGALFYVAARYGDASAVDSASGWDEEEMLVDPDLFGVGFMDSHFRSALATNSPRGVPSSPKNFEVEAAVDPI